VLPTVPNAAPRRRANLGLERLLSDLERLRDQVAAEGRRTYEGWRPRIARRSFGLSALNLAHYLALRRNDLRALQLELMPFGLSSLGRCEARVLPNLDAVIASLRAIAGEPDTASDQPSARAFFRGERLLRLEAERVFGPTPPNRAVRIMVTLPPDAATSYEFVEELVARGMDCARINCAHDDREAWAAMVAHVRRAASELQRTCRVCIDLAGPKVRTAEIDLPSDDHRVHIDDTILLCDKAVSAPSDFAVRMRCTIPEVVGHLRKGDPVWINDGRIGAVIEDVLPAGAVLRITAARAKGEKLRPDKGLNFPDTKLPVASLTDRDCEDLDFVAEHADIIGYSFVREPSDVQRLRSELAARRPDPERVAIMLKIETAQAVRNLPDLIVEAGGHQPVAVMIARGDLAVEIGYRRLAEMQEELLWLCEAASVPVVWATQVLDGFVKNGVPSRAEFTDAAMAERAECVMLNKGPYVADAVALLDDVLGRMEGHQVKKTSRLRALHSW